QTERRDVGAHESARRAPLLEHRDLVTERHEIVGDRERGGAGSDAGDALAVLSLGSLRQVGAYIVAMICCDAFQAADRHRLFLHPAAAARRLTRTIADAPENAWKHVRFAVDQIGVCEAPEGDEPNVFWNVGVRGAGPLAIDNAMIVIGIAGIGRFHPEPRQASMRRLIWTVQAYTQGRLEKHPLCPPLVKLRGPEPTACTDDAA